MIILNSQDTQTQDISSSFQNKELIELFTSLLKYKFKKSKVRIILPKFYHSKFSRLTKDDSKYIFTWNYRTVAVSHVAVRRNLTWLVQIPEWQWYSWSRAQTQQQHCGCSVCRAKSKHTRFSCSYTLLWQNNVAYQKPLRFTTLVSMCAPHASSSGQRKLCHPTRSPKPKRH